MSFSVRRGKDLFLARWMHDTMVDEGTSIDCIRRGSDVWYATMGSGPFEVCAGFGTLLVMKSRGVCFLNSSAVRPKFRGNGLHKRLIKARLAYAKKLGLQAITYTGKDNVVSANNLIACGFWQYVPENKWVGNDFNYWTSDRG